MKYLIFIILSIGILVSRAQNMVPNPSFENYTECPTKMNQLKFVEDWYGIVNSSIDFYHMCTDKSMDVAIPTNILGYQYPKTDSSYIGIGLYVNIINNSREYVGVELGDTLIKGSLYKFSSFISLANLSQYSISNFGVYFSKEKPIAYCNGNNSVMNCLTPQINNHLNNYLNDTLGWQEVTGIFMAFGGEKYITIGNFELDVNVNSYLFNGSATQSQSYYYIDDVTLIKLPDYSLSLDSIPYNSICYSDSSTLKLYFHNTGTKELDFSVDTITFNTEVKVNNNIVQSIETILSNNFNNPTHNTPLQPDSSMSLDIFPVDLSRLGELHDISITASFKRDEDTNNNTINTQITPILDVGNITVAPQIVCPGETVKLNTTHYIGEPRWQTSSDGLIWQNLVPGASAVHSPLDNIYYRVKICGYLTSDSILIQVLEVPEAAIFFDSICGAGNYDLNPVLPNTIDNLNWYYTTADVSPFHNGLSYTNYFEKNQNYYIQTIMDNCTSETKTPVHLIVEECPLEIPNVFTPNGDGINDIFYFHNAERKELYTEIYNRWGNLVDSWTGNPGWDGADLSEGVYYYAVLEIIPSGDKVYKGSFTLLR